MANFTELDRYLFGQATHYDIYRKLGAHFAEVKGVKGVYFRSEERRVGKECRSRWSPYH